jgi:hypothetical protein
LVFRHFFNSLAYRFFDNNFEHLYEYRIFIYKVNFYIKSGSELWYQAPRVTMQKFFYIECMNEKEDLKEKTVEIVRVWLIGLDGEVWNG